MWPWLPLTCGAPALPAAAAVVLRKLLVAGLDHQSPRVSILSENFHNLFLDGFEQEAGELCVVKDAPKVEELVHDLGAAVGLVEVERVGGVDAERRSVFQALEKI